MSVRCLVLLLSLGSLAIAGCWFDTYDTYYFHRVDGEIAVSGAITAMATPSTSSVPYGAGSYQPSADRLSFTFSSSIGAPLYATVEDLSGAGEYPLDDVSFSPEGLSETATGYVCGFGCDPCIVNLTEVSRERVSGSIVCRGLRSCDREATVPPVDDGTPECGNLVSSTVDVTVRFEMSEASKGPRDY